MKDILWSIITISMAIIAVLLLIIVIRIWQFDAMFITVNQGKCQVEEVK